MSRAIELLLADQVTTKVDYKVDWKEDAKLDFFLQEDLAAQTVTVADDLEVDASAQFDATSVFLGAADLVGHYLVAKNETQGLEIAVKIHKYADTGGAAESYAEELSVDGEGFSVFEVPAEALVGSGDSQRVTWAYTFSITTGLDAVESSIADFKFELVAEFDPAVDADQVEAVKLTFADGKWTNANTGEVVLLPVPTFDIREGDRTLIEQNSLNIGMPAFDALRPSDIDSDWAEQEGSYHLTLRALLGGRVVLENKVNVVTDVAATWTVAV